MSPLDAPADQQVRHPVGFLVKDGPGDLPAVGGGGGGLDQFVFLPGDPLLLPDLRVDLHQGGLIAVELAVALQQIGDGHGFVLPLSPKIGHILLGVKLTKYFTAFPGKSQGRKKYAVKMH